MIAPILSKLQKDLYLSSMRAIFLAQYFSNIVQCIPRCSIMRNFFLQAMAASAHKLAIDENIESHALFPQIHKFYLKIPLLAHFIQLCHGMNFQCFLTNYGLQQILENLTKHKQLANQDFARYNLNALTFTTSYK
jgi:hypothetical protein